MSKKNVFLNEKVAKKLFKNERVGKILSAKVISDILDEDYNTIYNNIKLSTDEISFSSKTLNSTADVIYQDDVHYFNIELNFYQNDSKQKQLDSYTYQLYLGQLHSYKDYYKIKRIIQISIDTYDYFNHGEFMYYVSFMEEKYHERESNDITKIHINLAYLQKLDYTNIERSGNKLMKDLYFFICDNKKELDHVYRGDNLMSEIVEESKKIAGIMDLDLYMSDEELLKMDQDHYYQKGIEEGIQEGIAQGIEQGIKQGIAKNQKDMAINLYNNGVSIDIISKCAGISPQEVKSIINN